MKKLDRDELVRLVDYIMNCSGCVVDLDGLLNQFESSVGYPHASQLIFNPPGGKRLSAEQVVEIALQEQPDA